MAGRFQVEPVEVAEGGHRREVEKRDAELVRPLPRETRKPVRLRRDAFELLVRLVETTEPRQAEDEDARRFAVAHA